MNYCFELIMIQTLYKYITFKLNYLLPLMTDVTIRLNQYEQETPIISGGTVMSTTSVMIKLDGDVGTGSSLTLLNSLNEKYKININENTLDRMKNYFK